jgi:putative oxidoreductase
LRIVIGIILIPHGYQKLFGGIEKFVPNVVKLGFPFTLAPTAFAYAAALAEFLGGILLVIGLLTRWAALFAAVNMAVAIFKVHLHHGLTGSGGFEFPLALLAGCVALMLLGGGRASMDRAPRKWP